MLRKKNIFVLMGGRSPEHEISLISGREVVNALNNHKYNIYPVIISKDGKNWLLPQKESFILMGDLLDSKYLKTNNKILNKYVYTGIENIPIRPDLVFIAMHGPFGEDGRVQAMLDLLDINYTGSGFLTSALGMDKLMFRKFMLQENIAIPKFVAIKNGKYYRDLKLVIGNPPYFIKPNNQGSSIGTSLVKNNRELKKALNLAWKYSEIALVDEYIKGIEVTCGVLGNEKPYTLPLVEIIPKKATYFDYNSKYFESGSEEIVPARITDALTKSIQNIALKVHTILQCRGFSRVDFILKDNKIPIVLEINTIPGLTPMSLMPKAAKKVGISYRLLIEKIVNYAFN